MQPCLIDLSDRAKYRLTGGDRERYLNGQVSNQVTRATPDTAIEACVCNVKGKLDGVIHITRSADGEAFWIDAPAALRDSLLARLGRYIIADDCELEDMTDELGLIHVIGDRPDLPGAQWRQSDRYGVPGHDLWVEPGSVSRVLAGGTVLDPSAVDDLRIRQGVPAWGAELGPDTLPAEVRLDERAVDFHKGCYLGQEVVSRLESVGRPARLLVLIAGYPDSAPVSAGDTLYAASQDAGQKPAGTVTSVASDGRLALAILRREFASPETKLVLQPENGKLLSHFWEVRTFGIAEE